MAKTGILSRNTIKVSATILLFVFWLSFVMLFTLFFSPKLHQLQNFLVMFTSLMFFTLGVVYVWSPVLDKIQESEEKRLGRFAKKKRKRR